MNPAKIKSEVDTKGMVFRIYPDHKPSFSKVHRSGWEYALNMLEQSGLVDGGEVALDTYVDRTFHTRMLGTAYESPWVGCIHHTFDTTFSSSNNVELMKNELFLKSLEHCKGLFVFSKEQRFRWVTVLEAAGYGSIPVSVLVHPTEIVKDVFSMTKFRKNKNKKLIQIGSWLRDSFGIYKIPPGLGVWNEPISKVMLKGPFMETSFCPPNFMRWWEQSMQDFYGFRQYGFVTSSDTGLFQQELRYSSGSSASGKPPKPYGMDVACRDSTKNQFLSSLYRFVEDMLSQTTVQPTVNNEEYDTLLSENLVFVRLIDAAAVNTVLECVVRCTPIVVNRGLTAIEDILGKDYPLYYDSVYEIPRLLTATRIQAAHDHLRRIDPSLFSGQAFIASIKESSVMRELLLGKAL